MMVVPYMFNDDLMDDLFNDNWERDFDRGLCHEHIGRTEKMDTSL